MFETTRLTRGVHPHDKELRRKFEIRNLEAHRCVPVKIPTAFDLYVVYGRSGGGKSASLRRIADAFADEKPWMTEAELFEELKAQKRNLKIVDEFGSTSTDAEKRTIADKLRAALYKGANVVIATNDPHIVSYLRGSISYVLNVDTCREEDPRAIPAREDARAIPRARSGCRRNPPREDFKVGLIIGNSTLVDDFLDDFREKTATPKAWSRKSSIVSQISKKHAKDLKAAVRILSAVGIRSVKHWLSPYHSLSTGQKARADLIPLITKRLDSKNTFRGWGDTLDEITRKTLSYSLGKALRTGKGSTIFQTRYSDLAQWLRPDWTLDLTAGDKCKVVWNSSYQPIRAEVVLETVHQPESSDLWRRYKWFHYLSHRHSANVVYKVSILCAGLNNGREVEAGMFSTRCLGGWKTFNYGRRFAARFVLRDILTGIGLGAVVPAMVGALLERNGMQFRFTTSIPSLQEALKRDTNFTEIDPGKIKYADQSHRAVVKFLYTGAPAPAELRKQGEKVSMCKGKSEYVRYTRPFLIG